MPIKIKGFQKGHLINKGKKYSETHKRNISFALKGKSQNWPHLGMLGKKQSEETKLKRSLSGLGKKHKPMSKEGRKNMSLAHKGQIPWNKGLRGVQSFDSIKGEKNYNWRGGVTSENEKIRHSIEFDLWRQAVFARDNFTCQKYGIRGRKLHPHHIQNFADYPELRLAIDNGITLSEEAHHEFHKKYGKKNNTREQLIEFLGKGEI